MELFVAAIVLIICITWYFWKDIVVQPVMVDHQNGKKIIVNNREYSRNIKLIDRFSNGARSDY